MRLIKDLPYARYPSRTLLLDLYLPEDRAAPVPVILWVCGGGWRGSSKDDATVWLAEAGFALAAIDYRVSGEPVPRRPGRTAVRARPAGQSPHLRVAVDPAAAHRARAGG